MRALSLLSLFFFLAIFAHAPTPAQAQSDDPFRKWLESLTIHVPDIHLPPMYDLNVSILGFTCNHLDFQSIDSALLPQLALRLQMDGIQIACTGSWDTKLLIWPHTHDSGGIVGKVSETNVDTTLQLVQDQDKLAIRADLVNFQMNLVLSQLDFSGDFSTLLNFKLIKAALEKALIKAVEQAIHTAVTKLVETDLTNGLLSIDKVIRPYMGPVGPDPVPPVPPGSMDLRQNRFIKVLDKIIDDKLGYQAIDKLMDRLTNGTGVLQMHNISHLHFPLLNKSAVGTVIFGISDIVLAGLNSWRAFDILRPSSMYSLDSVTEMDTLVLNVTFYFNITEAGHLSGGSLTEVADLSIMLDHNMLRASMQLALREATFSSFVGGQVFNINCLSSAVENVDFSEFLLNTTVRNLQLTARSDYFEQDLDQAVNNLLALFTNNFGPAIPAFLNGVVGKPVRDHVNAVLVDFVKQHASQACNEPEIGSNVESITMVVPMTGAFAAFLFLAFVGVRLNHGRDGIMSIANSKKQPAPGEQTPLINMSHPPQKPALVVHPGIPFLLRYGVLLSLCVNIALFIMSNTNVAASVYMVLTVGGQSTQLPDLFQFSLANSVRDMWNAEVYFLSIAIALFSGCWPYLKLLLMIFFWVVPTRWISEGCRETWFRVLDALGKWSLMDSFVMVLMLVAFRFHLPLPGDSDTSFDVYVGAHVGMTLFTAATMLSLLMSHLCLFLHRSVTVEHRVLSQPAAEMDKEALCWHNFRIHDRLARLTRSGASILPMVVLFCVACVLAGSIVPSFSFIFKGAAADFALVPLHISPSTDYSLLDLGYLMPQSSENPNDPVIRFLQVSYYIFAITMPLLNLGSLLVLWLTPLTLRMQHKLFVVVEIFNAWSSLDVFVLAIVASLLELHQFAQFIIGDRCDGINKILQAHFPHMSEPVCFDVNANLLHGCWVLFVAAVVTLAASVVVMRICHRALLERTRHVSRMNNINTGDQDKQEHQAEHKRCCKCTALSNCCASTSLLCFSLGLAHEEHEV